MTGGERGELLRLFRRCMATPDHVQIRAHHDEVGIGQPVARIAPSRHEVSAIVRPRRTSVYPSPIRSCTGVPSSSQTCGRRAPGHVVGT